MTRHCSARWPQRSGGTSCCLNWFYSPLINVCTANYREDEKKRCMFHKYKFWTEDALKNSYIIFILGLHWATLQSLCPNGFNIGFERSYSRGAHTFLACELVLKWQSQNDLPTIKMLNIFIYTKQWWPVRACKAFSAVSNTLRSTDLHSVLVFFSMKLY